MKAHLLIEEQVRQILAEHVRNSRAVEEADLGCAQAISLAKSFFPPDHDPPLWIALKKLNKLRNRIAHSIEPKGVQDLIADLIESFPLGGQDKPQGQALFEFTLWSLFVAVAHLVQKLTATVLQMIPGGRR